MISKKIKENLNNKYIQAVTQNDYFKSIVDNKHVKSIFPSVAIAIISTLFVFMLHFLGVFDSMELKLVDFRFNLRGPVYHDDAHVQSEESILSDYKDVVIVEIDDESFRLIPEPIPYGRGTIWSQVVRNLTDAGAKVIVIDVMFDKTDHQTKTISNYLQNNQLNLKLEDGDQLFLNAIDYADSNGTTVVLSGKVAKEDTRLHLVKPTSELIENNIKPPFGLVNVQTDSDGFIRKYPLFLQDPEDNANIYYTAAIEAVLAFKGYKGDQTIQEFLDRFNSQENLAFIGDSLQIKTYGQSNMFLINYSGAVSSDFYTFPRYSLSYILDTQDYPIGEYDEKAGDWLEDGNTMDNHLTGMDPETVALFIAANVPIDQIKVKDDLFENKIVVIGSSISEDHDLHPTPYLNYFDPEIEAEIERVIAEAKAEGKNLKRTDSNKTYEMPGVEIHANAIQLILDNNFISIPMNTVQYDSNYKFSHLFYIFIFVVVTLLLVTKPSPLVELFIIISLVVIWLSYSIGGFCSDYFWLFKSIANFLGQDMPIYATKNNSSELIPVIFPIASMVTPFALNLSYKLFKEGQDKKFLKNTFGNYISSELVDQMYKSKKIPELGGEEGYHTLIFSDIASFSSFSEAMTAPELVELLNEYLTAMTKIILDNGGTVDKYIGDAIVAFYGAPVDVADHENKAILTVVRMNEKLEELRKKWKSEGDKWPDLVKNMQHRVGINTGYLVTGNMGSELQMNYTCMGDTVNLAARLESGSKQWGIDAQVAESVFDKTKNDFIFRKLGGVRVKGKNEPVNVYELLCEKDNASEELNNLLELFEKARKLYLKQDWDKAIKGFEVCDQLENMSGESHTNPSRTYIKICNEYKAAPPGKDWDGVYTFKQK